MIEKISWVAFRSNGLLWGVNRFLHLFGVAIVFDFNEDGTLKEVYPARCKFRGFDEDSNKEGFQNITSFMEKNIEQLKEEVK